MARKRKYIIALTDEDLKKLKSIIRKKNTSRTVRSRCQILIDLEDPVSREAIRRSLKKTNLDLTETPTGVSPQKKTHNS